MKQVFKGQTLTTTKTVNNILRVYDRSNESAKSNWYREANSFANELLWDIYIFPLKVSKNHSPLAAWADKKNTLNKICGVIAALSPLKPWDENKRIAESFLKTGNAYHTKVMTQKAQDIMDSDGEIETICDILNGRKISSFFLNIVDPQNIHAVTIDRHAQDIALGKVLTDDKRSMTVGQYEFFANCYQIAAKKRGIQPSLMQSTTWVTWREEKKQKSNEELPF